MQEKKRKENTSVLKGKQVHAHGRYKYSPLIEFAIQLAEESRAIQQIIVVQRRRSSSTRAGSIGYNRGSTFTSRKKEKKKKNCSAENSWKLCALIRLLESQSILRAEAEEEDEQGTNIKQWESPRAN
jgi:hypothetical protein